MTKLSVVRKRAVLETKLLLEQLSESKLSRYKLHYEYHETFPEIIKKLKRVVK